MRVAFFTCILAFALQFSALGQSVSVQRPYSLVDFIALDANRILYIGYEYPNLKLEIYTIYGELLNEVNVLNSWRWYSQPIYDKVNHRIYVTQRLEDSSYSWLVFDDELTYLEQHPFDTTYFGFYTYHSNRDNIQKNDLWRFIINEKDSQLMLIQSDLKGKTIRATTIPNINTRFITYIQFAPLSDTTFLVLMHETRDRQSYLSHITKEGRVSKKITLIHRNWYSRFQLQNQYVYFAQSTNGGSRYAFLKYTVNGDFIDSFSVPVPLGLRDNGGWYWNNQNFIPIGNGRFFYHNEYRRNIYNEPFNLVTYDVDFNKKEAKIYREMNTERLGFSVIAYNGSSLFYAYDKDIGFINPNKVYNPSVWHSFLEFLPKSEECPFTNYPNPSTNTFTVESPCFSETALVSIRMYDATSRMCFEKTVYPLELKSFFETTLSSGLYHCRIKSRGKEFTFNQLIQ
jgi:hypothetical protein